MTRKKILGSHVKRLLSGVSDHGKKHLTEVETDLIQTGLLLEEAIEKLSVNFMAIHDAVGAQQQTINLLLAGGSPTPEDRALLEALHGQVGGHVNAAITSMQFQDMTSQLIDRTLKRVTGLREFLGTLARMAPRCCPIATTRKSSTCSARSAWRWPSRAWNCAACCARRSAKNIWRAAISSCSSCDAPPLLPNENGQQPSI